jgi:hypothetical protein
MNRLSKHSAVAQPGRSGTPSRALGKGYQPCDGLKTSTVIKDARQFGTT